MPRERGWLEWLLPEDRIGYREYRCALEKLLVIGQGRRGKGNLVLGRAGDEPDLTSPLPSVFAYGVIEAKEGTISILTREEAGAQIEIEIVPMKGDTIPEIITETKRWTYSTWWPGNSCPSCNGSLREVRLGTPAPQAVLAICSTDRRIWVYDSMTGVNHLIPITNFYNELMLHKRIREPKIALDTSYLFSHLNAFYDADLALAFSVYNKIRRKVDSAIEAPVATQSRQPLSKFLKKFFSQSS